MRFFLSLLAALALAQTATAATYTYAVTVTESQDVTGPLTPMRPEFELPDVGATGTVTVTLNDTMFNGSGAIPDEFDDISSLLHVETTIEDIRTEIFAPAIFPFDRPPGGFRISNGSFAGIILTIPSLASQTLAGSFTVDGPLGTPEPTTLSDIDALLANPGSTMTFSFNGTVNGSFDFVSFRAEGALIPPVPLPAGGVLLLTGAGALILLRRKRA